MHLFCISFPFNMAPNKEKLKLESTASIRSDSRIRDVIRYVLILFNLLLSVGSTFSIIYGALFLYKACKEKLDNYDAYQAIVSIVGGFIFALISFCGYYGAWYRNACLLKTYAESLVGIFAIQTISFIILALLFNVYFGFNLHYVITQLFDKYEYSYEMKNVVNTMQYEWKCCGVNGPSYWDLNWDWDTTFNVPNSCCPDLKTCNIITAYQQGCEDVLRDFIIRITISTICSGIIELTAAGLALFLKKRNDLIIIE